MASTQEVLPQAGYYVRELVIDAFPQFGRLPKLEVTLEISTPGSASFADRAAPLLASSAMTSFLPSLRRTSFLETGLLNRIAS